MFLNWLSGALVGVGGSDFIGYQCVATNLETQPLETEVLVFRTLETESSVHLVHVLRPRTRENPGSMNSVTSLCPGGYVLYVYVYMYTYYTML